MAPLPLEILQGVYLGLLTGLFPAFVAWGLGFSFKYVTGVSIPGFGVVVTSLALAGVNGGLLALTDTNITQSATGPVIVTAILVILMLSLYAHAKGDQMGATFPKRFTLKSLREQTLSSDVVEFVGGRGQVTVTVAGPVIDMEAYPPLPADLRREIQEGSWRFPAELPVRELEHRFEERLRTEFELTDVSADINSEGKATVIAAPPLSGLSKRIPVGKRAVSVDTLVPTGVARGDIVDIVTDETTVEGTIVSARSKPPEEKPAEKSDAESSAPAVAATTTGGTGRVTAAVGRSDVASILSAEKARVIVQPRGTRREFELLSLLRRAGKRFQKLTVSANASIVGQTPGEVDLRERYGVAVFAVRHADGWELSPRNEPFAAGDELFAVGSRDGLQRLSEVLA